MSKPDSVEPVAGFSQDADSTARSKRMYPLVLMCLLLSAGISVWALQRTWVTASVTEPGLPVDSETATGSSLYPASLAGAWLALACVVAIVAARGRWRSVVGVVVVLAAVATMVSAVAFPLTADVEFASASLSSRPNLQVTTGNWWILTGICALVIFACGLAVLRWSGQWRSLSARQAGTTTVELSDWEKLDRGVDPTAPADHDARDAASRDEPVKRSNSVANEDN
ncbi:MAG: Trp biosynthesis-associated membrane protein [Candidatus Nanopelagicales bacterium]